MHEHYISQCQAGAPYHVEQGAWGYIVTDRGSGYAVSGAVHMSRASAEAECVEANQAAFASLCATVSRSVR